MKIKRIYYLYIQAYIFNYINHTNIKLYDRGNSLRKKKKCNNVTIRRVKKNLKKPMFFFNTKPYYHCH